MSTVNLKERTRLRQVNAQAILLKNFGNIANGLGPLQRPFVGAPGPGSSQGNNFLINYGGKPDALLGLATNSDGLGPFINAPVDMLGQLTPKLQFSFSYVDSNGIEQTELFNFSDHTDANRVRELGKAKLSPERSIEDFLNKGTQGTDVGVQEFRWVWDNKHQGDRTIKAGLTLYFGSVSELLNESFLRFIFMTKDMPPIAKPRPRPNKPSETERKVSLEKDIRSRFNIMGGNEFNIGKAATKSPKPAQDLRQLKVAVGWSAPQNLKKRSAGLSEADYRKFLDGVLATQKVISLQLISYRLNFEQEGQVVLELEYVGSLDAVYSDDTHSNIFNSSPALTAAGMTDPQNEPIEIETKMKDEPWWNPLAAGDAYYYTEAFNKGPGDQFNPFGTSRPFGGTIYLRSEGAKRNGQETFKITAREVEYEIKTLKRYIEYNKSFDPDDRANVSKTLETGLAAANTLLSIVKDKLRNKMYSKFTEVLFVGNKIFYYPVGLGSIDATDPPIGESLAGNRRRRDRINPNLTQQNQVAADALSERFKNALKNFDENDSPSYDNDFVKPLDPTLSPDPTDALANVDKVLDGEIRYLYYVRLGDIIGLALSGVDQIKGFRNDVLLGSIIPSQWGAAGVQDGQAFPIASLPISLEHFTQWFVENISGPKVTQMSFRNFVDRLLNKLVAPVINQTVLKDSDKNRITFEMTSVTSPYDVVKRLPANAVVRNRSVIESQRHIATREQLAKLFPTKERVTETVRNTNNYYYAILSNYVDDKRNADKLTDESDGIYHLVLGSDNGLVKTYSFSEKKMPFLRAMHIENNSTGMALVLPQDVELTMVGNCIFRNGNIIYINADFAFGREIGAQLGLGGYYKVVKSENIIRSGKFETRLTCMFEKRSDFR